MKKTNNILGFALSMGLMVLFSACQKDAAVLPETSLKANGTTAVVISPGQTKSLVGPNTKGTLTLTTSNVYQLRNFTQGTVTAPADSTQWANVASTYYYSFASNDGSSSSGAYDFIFTGSANGNLTVNTTNYTLYYIDQAFDNVTSSSVSNATTVTSGVLGYNRSGTPGWYNYNITTHIVTPVTNRTIIIENNTTGTTYKLRINSIYKDGSPDTTFAPTDYPYYSIDYKLL